MILFHSPPLIRLLFHKRMHKDALCDVFGCILSHLPASIDILPGYALHNLYTSAQ